MVTSSGICEPINIPFLLSCVVFTYGWYKLFQNLVEVLFLRIGKRRSLRELLPAGRAQGEPSSVAECLGGESLHIINITR